MGRRVTRGRPSCWPCHICFIIPNTPHPPRALKIQDNLKLTIITRAVQYLSSRFTVLTMLGCHVCFIIPNNPKLTEIRNNMYNKIRQMSEVGVDNVMDESQNLFHVLMGKHPNNIPFESMIGIWKVADRLVAYVYRKVWG